MKELQESTEPLTHTHIQFAHCYKQQAGWSKVLSRFYRGNGTLYDLEFLTDSTGRRVAAFGFHAGFAGAAAGALALAAERSGGRLGLLTPFSNENEMVHTVRERLGGSGKGVKALVIGALGRCGRGAVDLFRKIGLDEYVHIGPIVAIPLIWFPGTIFLNGTLKRHRREVLFKKSSMSTFSSIASTLPQKYLHLLITRRYALLARHDGFPLL